MRELTRVSPALDLSPLHGRLNRLFGDTWRPGAHVANGTSRIAPAADVYESATEFVVTLELPGIDTESVDISATADELTVRGKLSEPDLPDDAKWRHRERPIGEFQRVFALAQTVDIDGVTAEAKHGVLTIRLPKKPEIMPKRIDVKID